MYSGKVRNILNNFKRHYNFSGTDILACYDTAVVVLGDNNYSAPYVTISISPKNWQALATKVGPEYMTKHPGSNVECLKLFGDLYVRAEARVGDDNVVWDRKYGCYTPTSRYLIDNMQRVVMAPKSTKKQVTHANYIISVVSAFLKVQ